MFETLTPASQRIRRRLKLRNESFQQKKNVKVVESGDFNEGEVIKALAGRNFGKYLEVLPE